MIEWLQSLIPWEKNLRSNRQAVKFSLQLKKRYTIDPGFRKVVHDCIVKVNFDQFSDSEDKTEILRLLNDNISVVDSNYYFDLLTTGPRIEKSSSVRFLGWGSEPSAQRDGISFILPREELPFRHCEGLIRTLDARKFNLGYFCDADYVNLQSRHNLSMYKYTGGLKIIGTWPSQRVDTSDRPGRNMQIPGRHGGFYSGAAHIWFGELAFPYLPRERILSFPHAERIEELPNGIIHLHLYEGIFDGDQPENQRRQYLLREHLGIGEGI